MNINPRPSPHKCVCTTNSTPRPAHLQGKRADPLTGMAVSFDYLLWDNSETLFYCFLDGYHNSDGKWRGHRGSAAQQTKVSNVITEWEKFANIKFEHRDCASQKAMIRIMFDGDEASWSKVGRSALTHDRDEPTMNLANIGDDHVIGDTERGVILHEFGHALGLGHEHQSPARTGKLTLDKKAFFSIYNQTPPEDVKNQVLDPHPPEIVTNTPKLDFRSIMMYGMKDFMNEERINIPENNELSELDKAYITIHYPFDIRRTNSWTIEQALSVAGVDKKYQQAIMESYTSKSRRPDYWKDMRIHFKRWTSLPRNGSNPHLPGEKKRVRSPTGEIFSIKKPRKLPAPTDIYIAKTRSTSYRRSLRLASKNSIVK